MEIKDFEKKILQQLLRIKKADPESFWPIESMLVENGIVGQDSQEVAKRLQDLGLISIHERARDCVCITEKGEKFLEVNV